MAIVLLTLFGALAAFSLLATWRDPCLWPIGGAIALKFTVANIAFDLQQHMHAIAFDERVMLLVIGEVMLATMAFFARMTGASRLTVLIVCTAVGAVCGHLVILMLPGHTLEQRHSWNLLTNLCYVASCVLTITTGLLERARQGRRDRRAYHARLLAPRDAYLGEGR